MRYWLMMFCLASLLALAGCSESGETTSNETRPTVLPAPEFVTVDEPKAFLDGYLDALQKETFVPAALVENQIGQGALKSGIALVERHHTVAFLEWYYSADYLQQVRAEVAQEMGRMAYQLQVMGLPEEGAARFLLVTKAGPLEQKKALQNGTLQQQWVQRDEATYDLQLSTETWAQRLEVVKEDGRWTLAVAVR